MYDLHQMRLSHPAGGKQSIKPGDNKFLPGYYLPETVLLMNEAAHQIMKKISINDEEAQDKESMKMVSSIHGIEKKIRYLDTLRVTKPLKKEFDRGSYLSGVYYFFLNKTVKLDASGLQAFTNSLKNLRQSAFEPGMWYFIKGEDWGKWEQEKTVLSNLKAWQQEDFNRRRRKQRDKLWGYLNEQVEIDGKEQSKLQMISDFVRTQSSSG